MGIKKTKPLDKVDSSEKKKTKSLNKKVKKKTKSLDKVAKQNAKSYEKKTAVSNPINETKVKDAVSIFKQESAASAKKLLYLVTFIVGFIGFLGSITDILSFLGYDNAESITSKDTNQGKIISSVQLSKNAPKKNKNNKKRNKRNKRENKKSRKKEKQKNKKQEVFIREVGSLELPGYKAKSYTRKNNYNTKKSKTRLKILNCKFTGSNVINMDLTGKVYGSKVKKVKVTYYDKRGGKALSSDDKSVSNDSRFRFTKTFWKTNNIRKILIEALDRNGRRLKKSIQYVVITKH